MLTSVLLHVGGLITVIIVSVIFSLFSSRRKKKRDSFFSQFMQQQEPESDQIIDNGAGQFMANSSENGHSFVEPSYSEIYRDDSSDEDDWIERTVKTAEKPDVCESEATPEVSKKAKPTSADKSNASAAKDRKPMAAVDDSITESEYSLKNLDDAKRAIVYSEILKRKYC